MQLCVSLLLTCCASSLVYAQGEFAFPFTAKIQARPTAAGQPAETFFLPRSAKLSCFDAHKSGSRVLCLSEMGSILEWTADNRVRRLAEGFKGPIQARIAADGVVWALDEGHGTLERIAPDGTRTQVMGAGTLRDTTLFSNAMSPATIDLAFFILPRDGVVSSVQLAADPLGNVYLFVARETRAGRLVTQTQFILRIDGRGTTVFRHWLVSKTYGDLALNLPPSIVQEVPPPTPRIDAFTVDAEQTSVSAINGQLLKLTATGTLRDLSSGNLRIFAVNPVNQLVAGTGGQTIIRTADGSLYSSVIGALDGIPVLFGKLDGLIAREADSLVGIDLFADRLLRYQPSPGQLYSVSVAAKLLHSLPLSKDVSFRPSFDAPASVSVDTVGQTYVVDAGDGNLYEIAPNGDLRRTVATDYVAERPPSGRFPTELFRIDALPYPIAAATKSATSQLFLVDTSCNLFAQLDGATVRFLVQLPAPESCVDAKLIFDTAPEPTLHLVLARGAIFSASGDPKAGEWRLTNVFGGGQPIRSISPMSTGAFLLLEGDSRTSGKLRIFNPTTKTVREVIPDRTIPSPFLLSSAVVMGGGSVLAVNVGGAPQLTVYELTDTGQLQPTSFLSQNRITLFGGDREIPQEVFRHPRGAIIRSNAGRLYFYPNPRLPDQNLLTFPATRDFPFLPGVQDQEISFLIRAAQDTAIGFRTAMSCDYPYNQLVKLGPPSGQTPANLTLRVQSDWVVLPAGRCTVDVFSVSTGGRIGRTVVNMNPDTKATAQIPEFGILDVLTPLRIDPTVSSYVQTLRVVNKTSFPKTFFLSATFPEGVTATAVALTVEPYATKKFDLTITPSKLSRQNYQIPLRISCEACTRSEDLSLNFQLIRGNSVLDLSSESVSIDGSTLTLTKSDRVAATFVNLTGIDPANVETSIDFRKDTPWFRVERGSSRVPEPGRFVSQYDVVLTGPAFPASARAAIVAFAVTAGASVPKRYLTVFYVPSDSSRTSRIETVASGGIVALSAGEQGSIAVPILNRSDGVVGYTVSSTEGGDSTAAVAISQGVIAKGANEVLLNISGNTADTQQSETKDILLSFTNGEQRRYRLGVVKTTANSGKSQFGIRAINKCVSSRLLVVPKEPAIPFVVVQNIGQRFIFEVRDECNQAINAGDKGKLQFSVQPPNGPVTATSVGNGLWEVFWKPERADENAKVMVVAVRGASEFEIYAGQISVSGRVASSAVPGLRSFSLVDAASFVEKQFTAPGSHISVFGDNLAAVDAVSPEGGALPRELSNVSVLIDGRPAPLRYVSKTQINLQVPFDVASNEYRMTVRVGDSVSTPSAVVVGAVSPGLFTLNSAGTGQGLVYHRDEQGAIVLADSANPARQEEEIWVLASGLGVTDPVVPDGTVTPYLGEGIYHLTPGPVVARIGGVTAPAWAALTPGLIGIYQVTASVPTDLHPANDTSLSLLVNGQESQVVTFSLK
jgi:uncharacterized protein (TIGR03437 family)